MAESKLETARQLIIEKQYDAARAVLETISDHPKAREWLAKLDDVAPQQKRKLSDLLEDEDDPFYYEDKPKRIEVTRPQRDYTNTAILVLILYWVMWLPGLIVNIITLNEANQVERETGRRPEGKGCLVALLWFNVIPAILTCLFIALMIGLFASGPTIESTFQSIIEGLETLEATPAR
jgi:hypothetical protein